MDFLTLEDIMSLKRLAVNMVEERILLSKADSGEYKIEWMTTEEIEKRLQEQNERSISSDEEHASLKSSSNMKDLNMSEGVKTITEELSKAPSESNIDDM